VIGDVLDDEGAEPRVRSDGEREGYVDEDRRPLWRGLDDRRSSKQPRKACISSADDAPDPHPVPQGERRARNMRKDHPAHEVRELKAPRAQERDEERGVHDGRVVVRRVTQPEALEDDGSGEREEVEERAERGLIG